jgi:tetratricopeptide (TPR) repeat protein
VAGKKILLLLDDAASHDQVRPLLPGTAGSLVLVTSRRRLTALHDATVISLDILSPHEAATLLARLAARPGMRPGDAAVGEITGMCGYLPLAIGMLASQLRHHPAWSASQLAAELAAAKDRLVLMHAENLSVAAAFGLSYADLTPGQQRLFRRLGLVPGPSIDAHAAAALDGTSLDAARRGLEGLYDQHLLAEPAPGRYQLHDLLREHARALAAAGEPAESDEAAGRLLDYYLHTALAAGRHFASWASGYRRPPSGRPPAHAPDVSTLGRAGGWLEAERANLHAAVGYAAAQGRLQHATQIPAAVSGFLAVRGHWDQFAALLQAALAAAREAGDRLGEADTLGALGVVQAERGDYPAAAASHQQALALARSASDRPAEAAALLGLGLVQQLTGDYPAAAASQQQSLALFRDLGDLDGQADALNCLGIVQHETRDYRAAGASQQQSLALCRDLGNLLGQAYALNDLGLVQQETGDYRAAAASHQQALTLFADLGERLGQAQALNCIGELATRTANTGQARKHHTQALAIARDLSATPEEARALEGLGRSHLHDASPGQAAAHLAQALAIYLRIGAPAARRVEEALRRYGQEAVPPQPAHDTNQ